MYVTRNIMFSLDVCAGENLGEVFDFSLYIFKIV